jgi:hypothetical protein
MSVVSWSIEAFNTDLNVMSGKPGFCIGRRAEKLSFPRLLGQHIDHKPGRGRGGGESNNKSFYTFVVIAGTFVGTYGRGSAKWLRGVRVDCRSHRLYPTGKEITLSQAE